jgi:hypothetical protein
MFAMTRFVLDATGFSDRIDPTTVKEPGTLAFPEVSTVIVEKPIVPWLSATTGTEVIFGKLPFGF